MAKDFTSMAIPKFVVNRIESLKYPGEPRWAFVNRLMDYYSKKKFKEVEILDKKLTYHISSLNELMNHSLNEIKEAIEYYKNPVPISLDDQKKQE